MIDPPADVERRTREIGRRLFALIHESPDGDAPAEPWLDRLMMKWTMRDEKLKAQLFRFIDTLPALHSAEQVNGHLHEYLSRAADRLPGWLGKAVGWMPQRGWLGRRAAGVTQWGARRMARRFIAATNLPEAMEAIRILRRRSLTFTIDLLGEAVLSESEADQYQAEYLRLVAGLCDQAAAWEPVELLDRGATGPIPRVNISVKLSSLYSQFDPIDPAGTTTAVRRRLLPILRLARSRAAFINVDMEQFAFKDLTLRIFKEVLSEDEFRDWADVGIAVQAYLRSCGDDLQSLAEWVRQRGTPVWVRLVKGAYWDYEAVVAAQNDWPLPVWSHKAETDANYETQTTFLMENADALRPAVASHNVRSIAHALAEAERLRLPSRSFEFQMLFGMAEPIKAALVSLGQRVRVYTPFGQLLPGMAYLVRRLLENTSNESFLRAGFADHLPEEQLLMKPMGILRPKGSYNDIESGAGGTPVPFSIKRFSNEPLSDFSGEEPKQAMRQACESVASETKFELGGIVPLIIGGFRYGPKVMIKSWNPSHRRQVIATVRLATSDLARRSVEAAKAAFPAWRDTPPRDRANLLFRSAAILRRRRFELAAWEVYETGKPWREADADVAEAIDFCEYYGREMIRLAAPQRSDVPGEENVTFYEPRGVAVVIAPWNFPLAILCGMTAAAVVAGNTAIMKPAEQSPVIAYKLMEVFEEAGAPAGVVNYLPGVGEEVGPALVAHPDVSIIAFTGSRAVGLAIQRQAAETPEGQDHLKRVITEMGGKNAVIVDEDADLDAAVAGVAASAFGYAGQKCSACSRAVVLAGVYDAFLARLIEATRSLKVGPAEDPGTYVGPVIDDEARQRILSFIEKAKGECRLAYAGDLGPLADEGSYVAPHIFADVPPTATIAREEIFGPVLAVMKANDLTHALALANGTRYALTGGLFSRSPANIERVRREFRVGNLYINRKITGALVGRQPFGGYKLSGIGTKAGGPDYLPQFLWPRTITENTLRHGFAPAAGGTAAAAAAGREAGE